jgi:hypothetical protein
MPGISDSGRRKVVIPGSGKFFHGPDGASERPSLRWPETKRGRLYEGGPCHVEGSGDLRRAAESRLALSIIAFRVVQLF